MPRRKITRPADNADALPVDASELPELTPKQRVFVEGILDGKTAADAYRQAYTTDGMADATIWVRASELRAHSKVRVWLDAARSAGAFRAICTFEGHLNELERLKDIALNTGNVGAAVQAEQLRGKASGHYVERHEDSALTRDLIGYLDRKAQELADDPDGLAQLVRLAERYKIDWRPRNKEQLH